jgi:hypothetical protein
MPYYYTPLDQVFNNQAAMYLETKFDQLDTAIWNIQTGIVPVTNVPAANVLPGAFPAGTWGFAAGSSLGIGTAAPAQLLTLNVPSTATDPLIQFSVAGTVAGYIGAAAAASHVIAGLAAGDLGIRAQSSRIGFSTDGGTNLAAQIEAGGSVVLGPGTTGLSERGILTLVRAANTAQGLLYFGSGGNAGQSFLYFDGTNYTFGRSSGHSATLSSDGTITTSGEWYDDGRRRKFPVPGLPAIVTPARGIAAIRAIQGRVYTMPGDPAMANGEHSLGFFAEELQRADPDLSDGKHFNPQRLLAMLVASLHDVDSRLAALERTA